MDANGTRCHLLLGRENWAACTRDAAGQQPLRSAWDDESPPIERNGFAWDTTHAELTLEPRLFQFVASARDVPPSLADRRGAGRDLYGNWYWIAANRREILVNSSGSGKTAHFWSAEDGIVCEPAPRYGDFAPLVPLPAPAALNLSGLAVTEDHYLIVGVLRCADQPAGLLVFDLFQGGAPREIDWPESVPFAPFDMAARPGGGVWILDHDHRQVWELDAKFRVIPPQPPLAIQDEVFQPDAPDEAARSRSIPAPPSAFSLDAASPIEVANPIAIEALPDNTILILDQPDRDRFALIWRFRDGRQIGDPLSTAAMRDLIEEDSRAGFTLRAHDFAFLPQVDNQGKIGQVYVAADSGNQTYVFDLVEQRADQLRLIPLPIYLPMRLFGGKAIVAGGGQVYYDFDDRWLPLVEQRRPRYVEEAVLYTPIRRDGLLLDGREPNCVWHRLFFDACIPPETRISVRSRAADELDELPRAAWQSEPPLYRRNGSEMAYVDDGDRYETWELLFQQARGRYLQLEVRLSGNEQTSPRIRAMRAYYPRFSYLDHYLPAVYREDVVSASFLDRFLANFEGFYTSLEDRIAAVQTLFDVRSAPADALDWLVSWFGVALDPTWEEDRRRLFIRYAMVFFAARGTLNGLHMALQLALEDCPDERIFTATQAEREARSGIRIIEKFRSRRTPGVVLGDPTESSGLQSVAKTLRWQPDQGGGIVQERYADFIRDNNLGAALAAQFSLRQPTGSGASAWARFAQETFGFIPSTSADDAPLWRAFLARRYRQIKALNDRYRLSAAYVSFAAIPLPETLPLDGAPLLDWYQFQAVVLPAHRTAHQFTALLPMPHAAYQDVAKQQERLALARRVLELEKPAHTTYEIKFYWGMFRVGEVRLGFDTLLDLGSRSPQLMTPMIIGQGHVVESYLAPARVPPSGRNYLAGDLA